MGRISLSPMLYSHQMALNQWRAEAFDPRNITRFCDVVMKGGVTSGVVYPLAICHLASKYIIKNIGGTSVGAIAAAITAAAEYQRRTKKTGAGYALLAKLPEFLTQDGTLRALFNADPGAQIFLNSALKFTGSRPVPTKIVLALIQFWWPTLLAGIALYWALYGILVWITAPVHRELYVRLHWGAGWLMLLLLLPTVILIFYVSSKWKLDHNDFGWGHGYHKSDIRKLKAIKNVTDLTKDGTPRLIGWLDAFIQAAAGRSIEDPPLTFGDLRGTHDPEWYKEHQKDEYGIDFRMVTTCLTLGRPFEVPFDPAEPIGLVPDPTSCADAPRPDLYFKKADMEKLFPPRIVQHLEQHGSRHSIHHHYVRFPAANDVPIVVAARLSMSFPILFCAVKLYATDIHGTMQPVWFSDGGLTSNFPIHFFDSPLPRWPTFAIDLLGSDPNESKGHRGKYREGAVFLESRHRPGTINPWNRLGRGEGSTIGFLMTIVDTARTWLDETSLTLRGNASRTIGIRLKTGEGGINLQMPKAIIQGLFERGQTAGELLLRLFASAPDTVTWQHQRWYRYRGAMGSLTRWLRGFETGYAGLAGDPQADYDRLFTPCRFDPARTPSAQAATKDVSSERSEWQKPPNVDPRFDDKTEPRPIPVFAQRRPL